MSAQGSGVRLTATTVPDDQHEASNEIDGYGSPRMESQG